jgi:osmoprotectant transport system ATP-binding protein
MSSNGNPAVEFHSVEYRANGRAIIDNLDLKVSRGETLVLLGRSGCGKTTTLKLINNLLMPSGGRIDVEGKSTTEWEPIQLRRHIGYVIQDIGLFPHFTVERNVALVPRLQKWSEDKINNRVNELLNLVGLPADNFAKRYPRELSGGQRQRVGVARALAADPPILLMDEPFGALDPITRTEIQREFRELQQRLQKTVVFVTHDMREAFVLGTRIGLMKDGRLVVLDSPSKFSESREPEARAFLETLGVNDSEVGDIK